MKLKTSVTLSEEVVRALDRAARKGESRSQAVDRLLRERLEEQGRRDADRRELELINRHATELNVEAQDVLTYQGDV